MKTFRQGKGVDSQFGAVQSQCYTDSTTYTIAPTPRARLIMTSHSATLSGQHSQSRLPSLGPGHICGIAGTDSDRPHPNTAMPCVTWAHQHIGYQQQGLVSPGADSRHAATEADTSSCEANTHQAQGLVTSRCGAMPIMRRPTYNPTRSLTRPDLTSRPVPISPHTHQ